LVTSLPDAPEDALPEVLGELVSAAPVEDEPVDGELVLLPDEPAPVAPDDELPMPEDAPVPLLPALPAPEPEDCENAALESASRAAAVAAVRVFNIMRVSFEGWMKTTARLGMQGPFLPLHG
jgi:hypothetical protein